MKLNVHFVKTVTPLYCFSNKTTLMKRSVYLSPLYCPSSPFGKDNKARQLQAWVAKLSKGDIENQLD